MSNINIPFAYGLAMLLFFTGLYGVITKRNLIKIIIAFLIMQNGLSILLLLAGYRAEGGVPVYSPGSETSASSAVCADPVPQAMVIILILAGFSAAALMTGAAHRLFSRYGTLDITRIREPKEQ